jgi:hypothetical protein
MLGADPPNPGLMTPFFYWLVRLLTSTNIQIYWQTTLELFNCTRMTRFFSVDNKKASAAKDQTFAAGNWPAGNYAMVAE